MDQGGDLRLEAHIEHAVGFVQDQDLDVAEVDELPGGEVLEAAGRGHQDVGSSDGLRLLADADAPVRGGHAQLLDAGDAIELPDDLRGQLTGRHQDQGGGLGVAGRQPLHDRQREGEGLARSRS